VTRHELKDGKWYLIKLKCYFPPHTDEYTECWSMKKCIDGCIDYAYEYVFDTRVDCEEWVEIDPELVFNLFEDPMLFARITGVGSCERGTVNEGVD
jgi:hypothetical protein